MNEDKEVVILSNQIECLSCGDRPYSRTRHDFKSCKCGEVSVDGGQSYLRRVGGAYKDMSIVWDRELVESLSEAVEIAINPGRNPFGVVCCVARTIRDRDYLITKGTNIVGTANV